MKKSLLIILVLLTGLTYGQVQIKKSSISSGGGSTVVGNTRVTFSIGEVAVQENSQGTIHISEGFIGPDLMSTSGVENFSQLTGIKIFPNPAIDFVEINFQNSNIYDISVYDISGKLVFHHQTIDNDNYKIPVKNYRKGVYMLIIKDVKNKLFVSYKLIKR